MSSDADVSCQRRQKHVACQLLADLDYVFNVYGDISSRRLAFDRPAGVIASLIVLLDCFVCTEIDFCSQH